MFDLFIPVEFALLSANAGSAWVSESSTTALTEAHCFFVYQWPLPHLSKLKLTMRYLEIGKSHSDTYRL